MSGAWPGPGRSAFWVEDAAVRHGVIWAQAPFGWWVIPDGTNRTALEIGRRDLYATQGEAHARALRSRF